MPGIGEWAIPAAVAGAGIIGGMINNASSSEQAHRNREFQQRMSSTAHQREVEDLRKAGINPMLSAKGGGILPVRCGSSNARCNLTRG